MDCFGAYLTHVQTCDNARAQSATQWTASAHLLYTCPNLCDDICVQSAMLYILYTFPNLWRCYAMDCFSACLTHSQTCDNVHGQRATQWTASVQAIHMPKPVMTFVFKVRHNGLLRYILHTCPKLWCNPCSRSSKCYGMHCFRTYFTHVQSCDVTRVQQVLRSGLLRYILHTCPKLWCNPCSKCYGVDCFGTYFTHVQSCDVTRWTASVHTSHMSKAVMQPVFFGTYFTHVQSCDVNRVQKVLRSGLLRYILHTCPKLWCNPCSKCYGVDCFGTYFTHVQSCDVTRVRSATQWTASVHTSHMSKAVM